MTKTLELNNAELTADDIFSVDDLTVVPFTVPEWKKNNKPGVIFFRVMSADRAAAFREALKSSSDGKKNSLVALVAECACSSDGRPLFSEGDMEKLRRKNVAVFVRMQEFLLKLNGMVRPDKSWETVLEILQKSGVSEDAIASVKRLWDEADEAAVKNS